MIDLIKFNIYNIIEVKPLSRTIIEINWLHTIHIQSTIFIKRISKLIFVI